MIRENILNFPKQFLFEPELSNASRLKKADKFILAGMGGSHLAAGLLKIYNPYLDLLIHRDYGLPRVPDYFLSESLLIASSYSGNTEETLDFLEKSLGRGFVPVVLTTGGRLLEIAKKENLPTIIMPMVELQPRMALGYSLKSLAKLILNQSEYPNVAYAGEPSDLEEKGKSLAAKLKDKVPIIYSSTLNLPLAYNWKIKMNETSKIPAFYNVFPELNHNEMTGFSARGGLANHHFLFLADAKDHSRIGKRMRLTAEMFESKGFPVDFIQLENEDIWRKIFDNLVLADWVTYYLSKEYGVEGEGVPMVEEFKKTLRTF